jgi:hypothetical protein
VYSKLVGGLQGEMGGGLFECAMCFKGVQWLEKLENHCFMKLM